MIGRHGEGIGSDGGCMEGEYLNVTLAADVAYGIAQPLGTLGALTAIEERTIAPRTACL